VDERRRRSPRDVARVERDPAGVGQEGAREHAQDRRLSGPVGADQHREAPRLELEGDVFGRAHGPEPLRQALGTEACTAARWWNAGRSCGRRTRQVPADSAQDARHERTASGREHREHEQRLQHRLKAGPRDAGEVAERAGRERDEPEDDDAGARP
jgi:hypothetical protein